LLHPSFKTADEPKKKKNRTKKKKSAKNRASSGTKTANGANNTPEQTKTEAGAMETNDTGENDEDNDDGEDELQIPWSFEHSLSSVKVEQSYFRRKFSLTQQDENDRVAW